MSLLAKQAGIISVADSMRLLVKTLIGFVLARLLTQADFGTYRQLYMIYILMSSIFMIGLPQSVFYFLPKADEEKKKHIITQTVDVFSILGIICALLLYLSRNQLANMFHNPLLNKALIIYAFYPFFMFLSQMYYTIMISMQQPRKAAIFVIFSLLCDISIILMAAFWTRELKWIISGMVLSVMLQWIYARFSLSKWLVRGRLINIEKDLFREQLKYSLPIGIAAIVGVVSSQIDKLVISHYFKPAVFAVFSVGAAELPFIGIITNSINSVILPAMSAKEDKEGVLALYKSAVRKNAQILLPICMFCLLFAVPLIRLLYSSKYLASVTFFRIYLLTMPLRIATYGIIFQVFNRTKYIFILAIITLLSSITLNYLFIKQLGIRGPAIATVVSVYINVLLTLILFHYRLRISIKEIFPFEAIVRIILSASVAGLVSWLVMGLSIHYYYHLALGGLVFCLCYFGIGSLFGAILPYDRALIWNFIRNYSNRIIHYQD